MTMSLSETTLKTLPVAIVCKIQPISIEYFLKLRKYFESTSISSERNPFLTQDTLKREHD